MRYFITSIITVLVSLQAMMAKQLDPQSALTRALSSNKAEVLPVNLRNSSALTLAYTAKQGEVAHYYVYNSSDNKGFVIVSADDCAPAILAYTSNGKFDFNAIPQNTKSWLSQYQSHIDRAIKLGTSLTTAQSNHSNISPLIKTQWSEKKPYDKLCKDFPANATSVTGSLATAMAQIMNFHQWPVQGLGDHTYSYNVRLNGESHEVKPEANFQSTEYDWNKMRTEYNSNYTEDEANAVATLMYHCGVSVNTSYMMTLAQSDDSKAPNALINNFSYDNGVVRKERQYFNDEQWDNILYTELAEGRPILYSERDVKTLAYSFVCDGYQNGGFYHINWGWGGDCDGYFILTSDYDLMASAGQGGKQNSPERQTAVIGIQRPKSKKAAPSLYCPRGFMLDYEVVDRETTITFHGDLFSNAGTTTDVTVGLKFTNEEHTYYVTAFTQNGVKPKGGWDRFTLKAADIERNGKYKVTPVYRAVDAKEWKEVEMAQAAEQQYIAIAGKEPTLTLASEAYLASSNNADPDNMEVRFSIEALSKVENTHVVAFIYPEEGGQSVGFFNTKVDMEAGNKANVMLTDLKMHKSGDKLVAGKKYMIKVKNYTDGTYLANSDLNDIHFTVVNKAKDADYSNDIAAGKSDLINVNGLLIRTFVSK